jgi:exodeoxyribonuclease-3
MKPLISMILFEIKKVWILPEERAWLDTFRKWFYRQFRLNKEPITAGGRCAFHSGSDNKGWRIDYCLSEPLRSNKRALILKAKHSDHCPVLVEVE